MSYNKEYICENESKFSSMALWWVTVLLRRGPVQPNLDELLVGGHVQLQNGPALGFQHKAECELALKQQNINIRLKILLKIRLNILFKKKKIIV
jgi:hypothetical protein